MAERQWGGKRTPRNPAPVSAPGALSRRTDGGPQQTMANMTGMGYGENQDFNDIQAQAPMSAAGQTTARATSRQPRGGGRQGAPMVPLFSATQRPDEPVTAGAPFGPGDGPPPMMAPQRPSRTISSSLMKAAQFDNDPVISRVAEILSRRGL